MSDKNRRNAPDRTIYADDNELLVHEIGLANEIFHKRRKSGPDFLLTICAAATSSRCNFGVFSERRSEKPPA